MKQHITKKQWQELEDKDILLLSRYFTGKTRDVGFLLDIGQMIEFLDEIEWNMIFTCGGRTAIPRQKHFCDILWEAVKYKLNQ